MTGKERIKIALNHEEPDRVPIDIGGAQACGIHRDAYYNLREYLNMEKKEIEISNLVSQTAKVDEDFCKKFNIDVRPILIKNSLNNELKIHEAEDHFWFVDEWQRKWKKPFEKGRYFDIVEFPLVNNKLKDFEFPNPIKPGRFKGVQEQIEYFKNNTDAALVLPRGLGNGFLQMGAQLYGYEKWFTMLGSETNEIENFFERYLIFKKKFWKEFLSKFGEQIDVICELDDLGMQSSTWISPKMYRNLIKPRQKELFSYIKEKADIFLCLHSDGSVYDFIPDLIEIGVDILNPLQISAAKMNPKKIKKEFGENLAFWGGGVNTQKVLPNGTPREVEAEVKKQIEILAPGGGYIFSAVHNIQPDVPVENIMAMIKAFEEVSSY